MFPPFMESADVLSIPPLGWMSSDSVKKFESVIINLSERICEAGGVPSQDPPDQQCQRALCAWMVRRATMSPHLLETAIEPQNHCPQSGLPFGSTR